MDKIDIEKKLKLMRLPIMSQKYLEQKDDPESSELSFDERFEALVDAEYLSRINNTVQRNIKNAHFSINNASLAEVNYHPSRKLDKGLIEELGTNDYLKKGHSIIIMGPSGCGKTWFGCAFGINACLNKKTVLYIRLPELFSKFEEMRIQGKYRDYIKKLAKYDLLILDEFLLIPASEREVADLLEVMEARCNIKSTIFCSQYSCEGWHTRMGGGPIADSILDRITNSSYTIFIQGKSMREEYSTINKSPKE